MTVDPLPENPKFGALEKVPVKLGWTHEAHELTPWLAENLDFLSQEIGLALEFRAREHPVGKYSSILLLSDARERVVIVENQFGATDHDHLGKLLTYCSGTDAKVVIWIAESMTEEHIAALQWLNDNTVADVGFFGVELELLKIADSPLAPHFRVVVQPNEWSKEKRAATPSSNWTWDTYAIELGIAEDRLVVGKELVARVEAAITARSLPWQSRFNKGYVAYLRKGGYKTAVVDVWWRKVPRIAVKLPKPPEELGLLSPYPALSEDWDSAEQEWGWTVPSVEEIPDVGMAIDIAAPFHPGEGGPMIIPPSSAAAGRVRP